MSHSTADTYRRSRITPLHTSTYNSVKSHLQEIPVIVETDRCLTLCDQCTGLYEDTINGNILQIVCHHSCHARKKEALAEVEGLKAKATHSSLPFDPSKIGESK